MEIFWSSIDLTRILFLLSAVLALIYKKKIGITPGGIIIPGTLLGIFFTSLTSFATTIFCTLICWAIYKLLLKNLALSKRANALVIIAISTALELISVFITNDSAFLSNELIQVSFIAPGLLTLSMIKYNPKHVIAGTLIVMSISFLAAHLLVAFVPYGLLSGLTTQLGAYKQLSLENIYVALPVSLAMAALIYYKYGIRGGGYLVAPFIAAVTFSSPIQAIMLVIGCAICIIATKLILKYTFIIGLERFVFCLFCAYFVITLMDYIATQINIPGYRPAPIVLIIAISVYTNDLLLQDSGKTIRNGFAPSLIISHLARLAA